MVNNSYLIIIILIALLLITNYYYYRGEQFFFLWNVIWLNSCEWWITFFSWKLRNNCIFFFFLNAKRDLNHHCFLFLQKLSSKCLKTRLRVEAWLWLANHHSGPQDSLFQQVIEHLLSSFCEMAISYCMKHEWPFYFSWKVI